jgi:hypothetical protein
MTFGKQIRRHGPCNKRLKNDNGEKEIRRFVTYPLNVSPCFFSGVIKETGIADVTALGGRCKQVKEQQQVRWPVVFSFTFFTFGIRSEFKDWRHKICHEFAMQKLLQQVVCNRHSISSASVHHIRIV